MLRTSSRKRQGRKTVAMNFEGGAVAITGAASGIGRALALAFAARGADLALCDIDAAELEATRAEIAARHATRVLIRQVNVADQTQMAAFAQAAGAEFPDLHVAINNAGVALLGSFDEFDQAQMQWLMNINFWGTVYGTRAFLPLLERQNRAHLVNLSSIFGIVAPAGQTAYCASKFAVRGFSEALRHELAARNSPVGLSVVHPGGIKTNIARRARHGTSLMCPVNSDKVGADFEKIARTTPAQAAARIIKGIERGEARILIGSDAHLLDWLQRLAPVRYWRLVARALSGD
jgi:short-subunit dehydrogenase